MDGISSSESREACGDAHVQLILTRSRQPNISVQLRLGVGALLAPDHANKDKHSEQFIAYCGLEGGKRDEGMNAMMDRCQEDRREPGRLQLRSVPYINSTSYSLFRECRFRELPLTKVLRSEPLQCHQLRSEHGRRLSSRKVFKICV